MTETRLTKADAERLVDNPSTDVRIETTEKIARQCHEGLFNSAERDLAFEIFRIMADDAVVRVRAALSRSIRTNPEIPHDLALKLAADVDEVAVPLLEASEVFSDDDLIEIAAKRNEVTMKAIARRKSVSEPVAGALIEHGTERVVSVLAANPGASLSEVHLIAAIDKFGDKEIVQAPLVHRDELPITVAERLVALVSESLRQHLLQHHSISSELAEKLALQSRERATVSLAWDVPDSELTALVSQIDQQGRLTASLILRAACMGQIRFMEHALAHMAKLTFLKVRKILHEGEYPRIEALYQKADLPAIHVPVIASAVQVADGLSLDGEPEDEERFVRKVIERVLTQVDELDGEIDPDDLTYLLGQIDTLPASQGPLH